MKKSGHGVTVKGMIMINTHRGGVSVPSDDIRLFFSAAGRPRVVICLSGTGSNAEKLLEKAAAGKSAYDIVCLFTDAPESCRAKELGEKFNVPVESFDIRKFYAENGEDDTRLNTPRRRELREQWSEKVWQIFEAYHCDFAVFAGFVPLTNLAEKLPCLNVHPGDLTVEKDGVRIYAGLHYEPVEKAILDGNPALRSSVILVSSYSGDGKKDLDGGPILGISQAVPVDLSGNSIEELAAVKSARQKPPYKDILRKVANENVQNLKVSGDHVVLPQTVELFAAGRYGLDKDGNLCFKDDDGSWVAVKTVEFSSAFAPVPRKLPARSPRSRNRLWRFCKYLYAKIVRDNGTPDYIARGWALGMFVGCVVPVFCQLVISVPLSFLFRGSKIGAVLATFITTPPTAVFIYPVQIWVGNKLIHGDLSVDSADKLLKVFNDDALGFAEKFAAFGELGWDLVAAFFAGGIAWALIMTPLTYFGVRYLVVRYRKMREKLFGKRKKA